MDGVFATCDENEEHVSLFSDGADKSLRNWVNRQRHRYKVGDQEMFYGKNRKKGTRKSFAQEQIDLLNGINFVWSPHEFIWDIRLNELT